MDLRNTLAMLCLLALVTFPAPTAPAQDAPEGAAQDIEVQTRGPVHEAFLTHYSSDPHPGVTVSAEPPPPIEELPPEVQPAGENVIWIPGYWGWDFEREDFIWISGCWRDAPPEQRWVSGYWTEVEEGWQWISGFWIHEDVSEIAYQPPPPESLESGPTSPAPSEDYTWVAGNWVYQETKYVWMPGFWALAVADWIWHPNYYVWTPAGVVYVRGYWDYRVAARGALYAPVYYPTPVYRQANYVYSPNVAIDVDHVSVNLFVNNSTNHYHFGDYYGAKSVEAGFVSWTSVQGDAKRYDPVLAHEQWYFSKQGVDYTKRIEGWHTFYSATPEARPPRTYAAQQEYAVKHKEKAYVNQSVLGVSHTELTSRSSATRSYTTLTKQQREVHARTSSVDAQRTRTQRRQTESGTVVRKQRQSTSGKQQETVKKKEKSAGAKKKESTVKKSASEGRRTLKLPERSATERRSKSTRTRSTPPNPGRRR